MPLSLGGSVGEQAVAAAAALVVAGRAAGVVAVAAARFQTSVLPSRVQVSTAHAKRRIQDEFLGPDWACVPRLLRNRRRHITERAVPGRPAPTGGEAMSTARSTHAGAIAFDEQRLDALAARLGAHPVIAGGVLGLVDVDGRTAVRAFGSAGTTAAPEPMRPDHRLLLTSPTKTFTATQALLLAQDGLLDLDAPVADYLPEFAANGKERVTTRHLLTHSSGIDLATNTTEGPPTRATPADHLAEAVAAGLSFDPGAHFQYCSPGFWVLAELVTRISGLDYTAHLRQRILAPLGLDDTRYEPGSDVPERYAPSRMDRRGHLEHYVRRLAYPAGGLITTAGDLLRYAQGYLGGGEPRLLGPALLDAVRRPQSEGWMNGYPAVWGLGWQLGGPGDLRTPHSLFQYGASGTCIQVDQERGVAVVLLTATWFLSWRIYAEVLNGAFGCVVSSGGSTR